MSTFQYAKSTDVAVVAAVERRLEAVRTWHQNAYDWAVEHGGTGFYPASFAHVLGVHAIAADVKPSEGQWRSMRPGWAPFKRNPLYPEFAALRVRLESIPGLKDIVYGKPMPDGRSMMMSSRPFAINGAAWVGFDHAPETEHDQNVFGEQWSEVYSSEFVAARYEWIKQAEDDDDSPQEVGRP